jgi:hypothetical protein
MKKALASYMNLITGIIFVLLITFSIGCQKHDNELRGSNTGCITRIVPKVGDYKVSGSQLDSIYALFSSNNLSVANLQFQYWSTDITINLPAYSGYQEQVTAVQFLNGLPVFSDNKFFTFNAGQYQPGGVYDGYTGPAPGADTTSRQTLTNLHYAFFTHLSESYREGGPLNSQPFVPSASTYADACLTATLGYLDEGLVKGNAYNLNKSLIKVWLVTPAEDASITYYPLVYVEDDNGMAWGQAFIVP